MDIGDIRDPDGASDVGMEEGASFSRETTLDEWPEAIDLVLNLC